MRLLGVVVLVCGCGRIGFTVTTDAEASGDGVVLAAACPSFASFCDGFESGNLDAWSGSSVAGTTIPVESSIVHTGHYALQVVAPPSTSDFHGWAYLNFPTQTSGMIAMREWVYAPQPLLLWDQVLAIWGGPANNWDGICVTGGANNIWNASEGNSTMTTNHASTTPVAQSTWVCVELDVMLATTGSTLVAYVADQEVVTASMVTPGPAYDQMGAGLAAVSGNGGIDYVDDVVFAAQHIGCQ
jgi:hypothetical protein